MLLIWQKVMSDMATLSKQIVKYIALLLGMLSVSFNVNAAEKNYLEENYYEGGVKYHDLTAGYPSWKEAYAKGSWRQNADNVWDWEVLGSSRFNASGVSVTGGVTRTLNEDWYGSLHLTTSDGVFFFPRFRVDAFLNRKYLDEGNLVGTYGLFYEDSGTVNEERGIYLGASYYFSSPWILEAGVKRIENSPGPEISTRYKIAVTHGRAFDQYLIAEVDFGNEAYQYVAATTSIVDVQSIVYTLTWRKWIKKDWGINLVGEYYNSDTYDRTGVAFGVFKHF